MTGTEQPANVLNSLMTVTRAGGAIGIPGLYVTDDPGAKDSNAKQGMLGLRIGLGWELVPGGLTVDHRLDICTRINVHGQERVGSQKPDSSVPRRCI